MRLGKTLPFTLFITMIAAHAPAVAKLNIVTTTSTLAVLAKSVGKDLVDVTPLGLPNQDPHFVDARPHLMLPLNRADVLLLVGLDMEAGWLPTLIKGARNAKILSGAKGYFDCSQFVTLREVPQGKIDRSMGDIHPGGNPHYLMDPSNALALVKALGQRFAALDAKNAARYAANVDSLYGRLKKKIVDWKKRVAPLKGKALVGYHRNWTYLAGFLGMTVVDHLEPKPGISPTTVHLLHVIKAMKQAHAKTILIKRYYPTRAAKLVAQKAGASLVRVAGGADFRKGESYAAFMDKTIAAIVAVAKD